MNSATARNVTIITCLLGLIASVLLVRSQPPNAGSKEELRLNYATLMRSEESIESHLEMLDEISNAELTELTIYALEQIDAQFQLWLSITFALLAACYIAKHQFDSRLKMILGILYAFASAIIFVRYFGAANNAGMLEQALSSRGLYWIGGTNPAIGLFRSLLIIFGTSASLWYLYATKIEAPNT